MVLDFIAHRTPGVGVSDTRSLTLANLKNGSGSWTKNSKSNRSSAQPKPRSRRGTKSYTPSLERKSGMPHETLLLVLRGTERGREGGLLKVRCRSRILLSASVRERYKSEGESGLQHETAACNCFREAESVGGGSSIGLFFRC